jgi:hypothetical protein
MLIDEHWLLEHDIHNYVMTEDFRTKIKYYEDGDLFVEGTTYDNFSYLGTTDDKKSIERIKNIFDGVDTVIVLYNKRMAEICEDMFLFDTLSLYFYKVPGIFDGRPNELARRWKYFLRKKGLLVKLTFFQKLKKKLYSFIKWW